jgi:hypothetical protein
MLIPTRPLIKPEAPKSAGTPAPTPGQLRARIAVRLEMAKQDMAAGHELAHHFNHRVAAELERELFAMEGGKSG